jgi:hypothetical protein
LIFVAATHGYCAVLKGPGALTGFRWLWRGGNTSSLSEQSS